MSLNDRFTKISKFSPAVQTIRVQMSNQHEMSAKNRRFAQQMSNRNVPVTPKGDVMSRLGTPSILSRLGYRRGLGAAMRRGRSFRGGRGGRPMFQVANTASPQVVSTRGTRRRRGGKTVRGSTQNIGRDHNIDTQQVTMSATRGQRRFTRGRGASHAANVSRGGPSERQWGGRGRGRGRGGRVPNLEVTKDQLDNELDEYMANTD